MDKLVIYPSVYDSIILKDVVEGRIKDIASFNKILQYILDTESKNFQEIML